MVHVTALTEQQDAFGLNVQEVPADTGTGFIWDEEGYVVTNFHVVQNAVVGDGAVQVTLADQTTAIDATVVGYYPDKDIAVITSRRRKDKLKPILIGKSANLQVGQMAYAIGNPFGLDHDADDRRRQRPGPGDPVGDEAPDQERDPDGRAINPGNSGGPLLDSAGRLIGMNTAIYSPSGSNAGIGFAIPVDEINRVVAVDHQAGRPVRRTPASGRDTSRTSRCGTAVCRA